MANSIEYAYLMAALTNWVATVLGTAVSGVVWYPNPGTKMLKPFIMLRLVGPSKMSRDNYDGSNLSGQRRFTVTVNAYGKNPNEMDQTGGNIDQYAALDLIGRLQTSLEAPNVVDMLYSMNIGIGEIMDAVDLSELIDTKYENRAAFDFFIFAASNVDTSAGEIKTAVVDNNLTEV